MNIKEGDLSHVALKGTEPKSKRSKKRVQKERSPATEAVEEADRNENETGLEGNGSMQMDGMRSRGDALLRKLGAAAAEREANANESNFRDERTNPSLGDDQYRDKKHAMKATKDPNSITNLESVEMGELGNEGKSQN